MSRPSRGYRVFQSANAVVHTLVVAVTLYPFVNIVARSFSGERQIRAGKVSLWPEGFNLTTYKIVFKDSMFWRNYGNTVLYTVVSTAVAMVLTTCYAYVLSKRHLRGRTVLVGIAVFTMFFTGGLIPNYVLITSLGLKNSIWAIALPNAISVFNLLVMKAFFENMPSDLEEAAQIDGLSTYGILLKVVLPLSKAVVATMALFYSVSFWNSWFSALLYLDDAERMPVTVYLRNLILGSTGGTNAGAATDQLSQVGANIQAVAILLTALPVLCVYPFVQRYFVKGVMLGAVKG
ncbi:carbohydrate ABC transporter permease [Streptomyces sp. NBC_01431]|uniref:carbohydrate ABC transporter permease n=1 Tax=Streptomyces sp. NBC_01431 TaxID=2903863 RepID=UPI002E35395B|nr:carbohydrate ABC transporter permease [Streptomyces sp. NBC_01431]